MPALFAYLIAVGLLLGGGYGALTWLAAPEPVKVAIKAKPTPQPHFDEENRDAAFAPNGARKAGAETISQSDQAVAASNQPPAAPPAEASTASTEQGAGAQVSAPAQVQQDTATKTEISSADVKAPAEHTSPARAASPGNRETNQTTATSAVPAAATKTAKVKRPQQRLASHSERPALELMTLRTIEFPDGHRVTQLLPYRGGDRD
jgi:hypothetical protein